MIPAVELKKEHFHRKFAPGGNPASKAAVSREANTSTHPILNDIPPSATSCLVYKCGTLKDFNSDSAYLLPTEEEFPNLRKLESLQAVVKAISVGKAVFSHMFVDPDDVLKLFGDEFIENMKDIQRDVKMEFYILLTIDTRRWRLQQTT